MLSAVLTRQQTDRQKLLDRSMRRESQVRSGLRSQMTQRERHTRISRHICWQTGRVTGRLRDFRTDRQRKREEETDRQRKRLFHVSHTRLQRQQQDDLTLRRLNLSSEYVGSLSEQCNPMQCNISISNVFQI